MRKAALLYNPLSGGLQNRREAVIAAVVRTLRDAGVDVATSQTRSASDAAEQARQFVISGCETLIACGGDGTVHDVLQGIVGTPAALGVIPMGTANALAHDLGLPLRPVAAARALLDAEPRRIALGRIQFNSLSGQPDSRYFTVAAGIGVDAHLFYKLSGTAKQRLGMAAYYAKATALWLTHKMANFEAEFVEPAGRETSKAVVSELLAVRITQFGGVLRELAPGAALARSDVRLVLFKTNSRLLYLGYILRGLLGTQSNVPRIELRSSDSIVCRYISTAQNDENKIYVEADGELLGTLPAEISIVPDALTLLVPRKKMG